MESFFSSLKTERTARKVYRSREQARADVFDDIERFYNPTRRHSTLGYISPINFEKTQEAWAGVLGTGSSPPLLVMLRDGAKGGSANFALIMAKEFFWRQVG